MKWGKILIAATLSLASLSTQTAQAVILPDASHMSSVPDAFGYSYIDSLHANGPAFDFIDITGSEDTLWSGGFYYCSTPINVALGFSFPFYGSNYTSVNVSPNGYISFDNTSNCTYWDKGPMGTGYGWGSMISAYWSIGYSYDIKIRSKIYGTAPDRYTIIQIDDHQKYYSDSDLTSYQYKLYENGNIEIHYRQLDRSTRTSWGAYYQRDVWGIQNAAEDTGLTYFDGELDDGNNLGTGDLPLWFTDEITSNGGIAIAYKVLGELVASKSNITTDELGTTDSFDLSLLTQPTNDVVVQLAVDASEGLFPVTDTYTFTSANWNVPQSVTIQGVDDFNADADQTYSVSATFTSADPVYNGVESALISVLNRDDEIAGFEISGITPFITSEGGGSAAVTISLLSTAGIDDSIRLPLSLSDNTEASIDIINLQFNPTTFSQTVTITGKDDPDEDGDIDYQLVIGGAVVVSSEDAGYTGLTPGNVNGTNLDNDFDGFTFDFYWTDSTTEQGGQTSFRIRLNTAPSTTDDVVVSFSTSDLSEAYVLSGSTLTFNSGNWNLYQTVTLRGVDDGFLDAFADPRNSYKVLYTVSTIVPEYIDMLIPELDELLLYNLGAFLDFLNDLPGGYLELEDAGIGGSTDDVEVSATTDSGALNPLLILFFMCSLIVIRKTNL